MHPVNSPNSADQPAFWSLKPWWCQPWSILSTGVVISVASWLVLHRLWVTIPVTAAVVGWWLLFLVLVPAAYRSELSQQG